MYFLCYRALRADQYQISKKNFHCVLFDSSQFVASAKIQAATLRERKLERSETYLYFSSPIVSIYHFMLKIVVYFEVVYYFCSTM